MHGPGRWVPAAYLSHIGILAHPQQISLAVFQNAASKLSCNSSAQVLRNGGISRVVRRPKSASAQRGSAATGSQAATAAADAAAGHSALEICAAVAATSPEGRAVMVESGAVPAAVTALKVYEAPIPDHSPDLTPILTQTWPYHQPCS